ncbi:polysaccharide biosynthesis tyrosine autokinase [Burkholderia cenocepacia]|uniref:polysaccharide biosynthesis tyrosine autokinase n=1 Tax=Burkholderia cenocepacia TaxID=95486 RepID=UPI001B940FEE|nr:polysaccharide biosynthesis tyrosine autokinase [Burkholderia cenocepacia]MBR8398816.1 polysaccharide biosynthesis tyrosine autokinase [Burkholderia cenocepacia]
MNTASPPEREIDLIRVLDVLRNARWTITAIAAACIAAGALYAFVAPPTYQADLMIQTDDATDTASKNLLGDAASFFNVGSPASAEAQILSSRLVVTRAVEDLRSYIVAKPSRVPVIGAFVARFNDGAVMPGLLGFGGYAWGQERVDVARFDVPTRTEGDTFHVVRLDATRYRLTGADMQADAIGTVGTPETFDTRYGPLHVEITGFDALPGTRFKLIRQSRAETIDTLRTALDVQEKVKQSGVLVTSLRGNDPAEISATLNAIATRYVEQNIVRRSAEAAQSLTFLNGQLPIVKQQLERAETRYASLRSRTGSVDLAEEGKLALQQGADLQTRALELEQKRDELSRRFLPTHPDMAALDAQLATLKQQQGALEGRIARLPARQAEEVRAQLDVKVNTDLYTALLNNIQQLELVQAGRTASVRVVDAAVAPADPVRPNRPVVIVAAALAGLALGVIAAFMREFLYGGLTAVDEIERHTSLPVRAVLPAATRQRRLMRAVEQHDKGLHVLAYDDPYEPAIEGLRSLQTALHFSLADVAHPLVLVSGPAPGTGKSFVSVNLAAVHAASGRRVLLIDGDLRKGYLHQYFGLDRGPGFAELLEGRASADDVVRRGVAPNLDFLPTGELPHAPTALLQHARAGALLASLRARYDLVVIDSAPLLAATDATWLDMYANAALLVARAGSTRAGELVESAKRLPLRPDRLVGVVLNGLDPRSGASAFGSKYGGYRYEAYRYTCETRCTHLARLRAALQRLLRRSA